MLTVNDVVTAWRYGRVCYAPFFKTDGVNLYSNNHLIGWTYTSWRGVHKTIADCHASPSTRQHVAYAKQAATMIVKCIDHPAPVVQYQPGQYQPGQNARLIPISQGTMSVTNDSSDQVQQSVGGTRDGTSYADNDRPYTFGNLPRAQCHSPFTERQFARLMILRSKIQDGEYADDLSAS